MATLTAANSVLTLSIAGLFPVPVQLSGFSTEDIFSTEGVDTVQVQMGVDGNMSAGWVAVPKPMTITLQADSPSTAIFDNWYAQQEALREALLAEGLIVLPGIASSYVMIKGAMTNYAPTPDAKKLLQPRRFTITWQNILPQNFQS